MSELISKLEAEVSTQPEAAARIAQDIDGSQLFVHFENFATNRNGETEDVFAATERAASRGVKVRQPTNDPNCARGLKAALAASL